MQGFVFIPIDFKDFFKAIIDYYSWEFALLLLDFNFTTSAADRYIEALKKFQ